MTATREDTAHLALGSAGSEHHTVHFFPGCRQEVHLISWLPMTLNAHLGRLLMCDVPRTFHRTGRPKLLLLCQHSTRVAVDDAFLPTLACRLWRPGGVRCSPPNSQVYPKGPPPNFQFQVTFPPRRRRVSHVSS